jgi:hypothetical protein
MKERILKIIMTIAFVLCTFLFLSIRFNSPAAFNLLLKHPALPEREDYTKYGENYYNSGLISYFREDMPRATYKFRFSDQNKPPQEADVLMFGDSHFDFNRQPTFAERIADSLGIKVYLNRMERPYKGNILAYLNDIDYQDKNRKLVFYESSERYVIDRSSFEYQDRGIVKYYNPVRQTFKNIKDKIFNQGTDNLYNTFLKKSYLTSGIYSWVTTAKFNIFNYMNQQIQDYVIDEEKGSWAFHQEPVTYYNREDISDSLIVACAQNIQKMQKKLSEQYNLELVYMILPEKYTMYNLKNTVSPYHQFVPRIHKEFERLGIPYINLFYDFSRKNDVLYYRTDTHWNPKGVDIAVKNALEFIRANDLIEDR